MKKEDVKNNCSRNKEGGAISAGSYVGHEATIVHASRQQGIGRQLSGVMLQITVHRQKDNASATYILLLQSGHTYKDIFYP